LLGHCSAHAQAVSASLDIGVGDSAFRLVADTPGLFGNSITFEMLSSPPAAPLSVTISQLAIVVRLGTDFAGVVTSTAGQVVSAINATPAGSALVDAVVLGSGLGIEVPFASTSLSGGAVSQVSPIPEPETYAMLLAGLGLLGFEARRRKKLQRAVA
jgi:hypothetical protein